MTRSRILPKMANNAATPDITIPEEFPEVLRDLNRAILESQPADIIKFCAEYFNKKVAEGKQYFSRPYHHHRLQ